MSDEEKHRLKELACKEIDSLAEELNKISEDIWNNPELGYEEKRAHGLLTSFLKSHGFQTELSYKLDTAFKATYGNKDGGPNMCFISEYDALPEIGHACGHNLIAEVGVAAGCGLMAAMKSSKCPLGMVTVLGTPAEEGAGGKIDLIDAGAFDDVDVAMMAHPFPDNDSTPTFLARETLQVTFTGKPSHAAAFPWEGVNALDAAVTCYQALACLRQQTKPSWRIHCIVKEGGVKVNIIPERAVLHVAVRAPTDRELAQLKSKAIHCIQAGASASGCKVEWELFDKAYSSMMHNLPLVTLYEDNLRSQLPQSDIPCRKSGVCGSTDMGNVAHVVPGIHPNFSIGGSAVNHTRGFTADAGAPRAQPLALTQAKCLAMTAIDVILDKDKLNEIQTSFKEALKLETGN